MKLAEIMLDRGMTDSELAKAMSVQQSTIFQWKAGGFSPKANSLFKLCEVLNCSTNELLGFNSVSVALPDYQGQRLYKAVTQEGNFDSHLIHIFATRIRRLAGKATSLEVWMRHIAEALYEIELAQNDPTSLSHPAMAMLDAPAVETMEFTQGNFAPTSVVEMPSLKHPSARKIDRKRRKKALSFKQEKPAENISGSNLLQKQPQN